jgi:mRNA-degrading endonuclease RelE of RelBE toxin-antitoxin system
VKRQIEGFLRKLRGESINIDVKKLKGKWKGYFRIRKGKLRIIFFVDTSYRSLYVETIDFRGAAYK